MPLGYPFVCKVVYVIKFMSATKLEEKTPQETKYCKSKGKIIFILFLSDLDRYQKIPMTATSVRNFVVAL